MNLMLELKSKLQERKANILNHEAVSFKVFDSSKDNFVETSQTDREVKQEEHQRQLAEIKRKEEAEKREVDKLIK